MDFIVVLAALCFLMFAAYRGFSVILIAPIAALGAVLLTQPIDVAPAYSSLFMEKMVFFVKNYFPVFLLGAIFGKVIEMSGFSKSIVAAVMGWIGQQRAIPVIVLVCMMLTYGGVSLFVVVFAVYPFAAEMFRQSNIPKRLIPGTIALGAFTITMDALPGTPQIQNIIPTEPLGTTSWSAPILGILGGSLIVVAGLLYLNHRRKIAAKNGEGYDSFGQELVNEPAPVDTTHLPNPILALTPLVLVGVTNFVLTYLIPKCFMSLPTAVSQFNDKGDLVKLTYTTALREGGDPIVTNIKAVTGIWAVEGALVVGILFVVIAAFPAIKKGFAALSQQAVGGAMLASMNTASEFGFGGVIAALPGFLLVSGALASISDPLIRASITVTSLAGITGSASGGMSIALAAVGDQLMNATDAAGIPRQVLHRVVSMASGGMDTLPHNGAVITVLAVTGLTHKQSYKDIFVITVLKTLAVFVVIAIYYTTGLV